MAKVALLIGVSEYQAGLNVLPAAVKDVAAMQRVLQDHELGEFDAVKPLLNPDPYTMQTEIETFLTGRHRDDLVLLYFSGHGIKDDFGNLYFATRLTQKNANGDLVRSSTVSARFVHEILHNSRAKRQVIILDCCFSGAFDPSLQLKDDGSVNLPDQLGAEGRVVLASSSLAQPSLAQSETELSLYTRYLIEGIETGAGDLDEDGKITIQELHHYAFDRVRATAPNMTPKLISLKDLGFEIILSKARVTDPQLKYRKTVTGLVTGGKIRPSGRAVLDILRQQLGLTQTDTDAIEAEVLRPYQECLANLQKYREALLAEAEHEYPFSQEAQDAMAMLQKLLGLREEDIASIMQQVEAQFVQQSESTVEEFWNRGLEKDIAGDESGANADFDEVIRLQPNSAYAYCIQAGRKRDLKDYQGAIEDCNEAIRLKPDLADAYNTRGRAKYDLGDYQGAIEDFNQAIRLKPNLADAYNTRGLAKSDSGDYQGAIEDLNQAIRLKPDDALIYYNRGFEKSDSDDNQGAIEDFNQAIRLKPNLADAYYERGAAKYDLGDYQGAIEDCNEVIRLKPDYAIAYHSRGAVKYDLGDYQGAVKDFNQAIRLQPDDADAYFDRGSIKSDSGDEQGAIKDFQSAAKLYQQQGNTEWYQNALNRIKELEK